MPLTRAEKERIVDNRMKLQSVARSLKHVDPSKIHDFQAIQDCLEDASENLAGALRSSSEPDAKR
jgi:hypothetical protein